MNEANLIKTIISLYSCPLNKQKAVKLLKTIPLSTKEQLAASMHTPGQILEKLSTDEDCWVRRHVAENPSTPTTILEKLSADENSFVRRSVPYNPTQ